MLHKKLRNEGTNLHLVHHSIEKLRRILIELHNNKNKNKNGE